MNWDTFLFVLLAAAANVLGGLLFVKKINWSARGLHSLMALSAGLLISIAILDFIPNALEHEPSSPAFILLGLLLVYFFQQYVAGHFHFGKETHVHAHVKSTTIGAMSGMLIHTFFDGLSIAASFEVNKSLGITVFIAVLLHKIPDGLTISSIIFVLFQDRKKAVGAACLLGLSTVAGALAAFVLANQYFDEERIAALSLAFSAGIFLYVAATDLLPVVNAADDRRAAIFVFVGVIMYFVLHWGSNLLSPTHH